MSSSTSKILVPMEYTSTVPSAERLLDGQVDDVVIEPGVRHSVIIGAWFSPLEFHVVFLDLARKADRHFNEMNYVYDKYGQYMPAVKFAPTQACVVKDHDEVWRRAVVEHPCDDSYAVLMVDVGATAYIKFARVKPLLSHYAKYPPLARICRLKGCHRDICYGEVLDEINKYCVRGRRCMVSFDQKTEQTIEVDLFNMVGNDIFKRYFGPLLEKLRIADKQRQEAQRRGLTKSKTRRQCISDSTESEEYTYASDEDQFDFSSGVGVMINRRKVIPNIEDHDQFPSL